MQAQLLDKPSTYVEDCACTNISYDCHCEGASATEAIPVESQTMNNQYCIYIMSNDRNTTLYTGVTNNLKRRVYEHKNKLIKGFTTRYNITKLVYYEMTGSIESAILREKQIKSGSRKRKVDLISKENKNWNDLYEKL